MDSSDALSRSRCRERRLNNFEVIGKLILNLKVEFELKSDWRRRSRTSDAQASTELQ